MAALQSAIAARAEQPITVTASVGISLLDGTADEVLARADFALYDAKRAGRNRIAVYRADQPGREGISARISDRERVRRAIDDGRLLLFAQPILDLRTNEVSQYELLLRLADDDGKALSPGAFLLAAERSGLIQMIDSWVVRRAIALIAGESRIGHILTFNVNLSGRSIGDATVAAAAEEALAAAGIDPRCLVFEVTETAAITDVEEARSFAGRLRARGCRFALDDFGAGSASFYSLKNFPFDYLKIDGDFVRDLLTSQIDQLVVRAMVDIAHSLRKKVIAEFVPDDQAADMLRELGVDGAQGYHFGIPEPVANLLHAGT